MYQIDQEIKTNRFSRIHLLCGEEVYLINAYRQELERRILPPEDELNRLVLAGKEADETSLSDFGMLAPFMGNARLITVKDSGWFHQPGEKKELRQSLETLPETTYVIFSEREVNKKTGLFKYISGRRDALVTELKKKNDREILGWIDGYVKHHGAEIRDKAAKLLLERIGSDMYLLSRELDKLIGYVGERKQIREEDVETIAGGVVSAKVYEMVDAVSRGDSARALGLYRDLVYNREDIGRIMFYLGSQFNQMYLLKKLEGRGLRHEELAKKTGVFEWKVDSMLRMARRFEPEQLMGLVNYWTELDESVKTTGSDRTVAAELFLIRALTNP